MVESKSREGIKHEEFLYYIKGEQFQSFSKEEIGSQRSVWLQCGEQSGKHCRDLLEGNFTSQGEENTVWTGRSRLLSSTRT